MCGLSARGVRTPAVERHGGWVDDQGWRAFGLEGHQGWRAGGAFGLEGHQGWRAGGACGGGPAGCTHGVRGLEESYALTARRGANEFGGG